MTVMRELRRRLRTEQSLPRFDPCLPRSADRPPAGPGWIHEIKHDGFQILAHRQGRGVRLVTRNGHDLADRFPLAAAAIAALPVQSCVVDGEAIVCDDNGLAVFNLVRGHGRNRRAILCAFDLLEVNGEDIRVEPIEERKRRLAGLLRLSHEHACALGCEGIVSKRLGSPYRAGRSAQWLKIKNPDASRRLGASTKQPRAFASATPKAKCSPTSILRTSKVAAPQWAASREMRHGESPPILLSSRNL
jgi:bifunctional non-homologous end joining protein LigD